MGKQFIPSPRRQIYIGNIAFNATEQDVMQAIDDLTHNVCNCTMPRSGDRNRGYAFVTIVWPSEFKHNGVDMDTFCDAIHHLNIKGRPSTRRRRITVTSDQLHLRIRRGATSSSAIHLRRGCTTTPSWMARGNPQDSSGPLAAQEGEELCLPDDKQTWSQARSVEPRQP